MTATRLAVANPYWDAVRGHVDFTGSLRGTPTVGGLRNYRDRSGELDLGHWSREVPQRAEFVRRYSWTITDPTSVAFVAEHSRGRLVDPMAGTGYWASVLAQSGVDVAASDLHPPTLGGKANHWHMDVAAYCPVFRADAADAVTAHPDRTLLLSWPPYDRPVTHILDAYRGNRLIYIGEGWGGCCGDDDMFAAFERGWTQVAEHTPVQWDGMHDQIQVFDRKDGAQWARS